MRKYTIPFILLASLTVLSGCNSSKTQAYALVSPEGLILVDHPKSQVNAIYIRQEADFNQYDQAELLEPQITFKSDWLATVNAARPYNPVTEADQANMIEFGQTMLIEEFTKKLSAGGYEIVSEAGPKALGIKASVSEMDVFAPDPNNTASLYADTYTRGGGSAVLTLELYDTMTGQILARVVDRKMGQLGGYNERTVRTQQDNIEGARETFAGWAEILVNGLELVKADKSVLTPRSASK